MSESREAVSSKDTGEVIMEATFRALSKHGYNDLRMRDIGEEMDLTRQVIHYHFDGKYDLLSAFLEDVIDQYEGSVEVDENGDPRSELDARIDQCLFGPEFEKFSHWERMKIYHELYTHSQNDGDHREVFNEHYDRVPGTSSKSSRTGSNGASSSRSTRRGWGNSSPTSSTPPGDVG